jgi:hypothetical protein
MNSLAIYYSQKGRTQQANRIHEVVRNAACRVLGATHPDTLVFQSNLAHSYMHIGLDQESYRLQAEVLVASCQTLGDHHPISLMARDSLEIFQGSSNQAATVRDSVTESAM